MWRNIAKQVASTRRLIGNSNVGKSTVSVLKFESLETMGVRRSSGIIVCGVEQYRGVASLGFSSGFRGFASAAEAVAVSSTDEDEVVSSVVAPAVGPVAQARKKTKRPTMVGNKTEIWSGYGQGYVELKARQVRNETEAWENAAIEYNELVKDMCKRKLAPNLPFMKQLFLGWFEPLKEAIEKEQGICTRRAKGYIEFMDQLPADKMAIITMHKIMALLMADETSQGVRLVHAASAVGKEVEHEGKIHALLESTKKNANEHPETGKEESDVLAKEKAKLRKKVQSMIKQRQTFKLRPIMRKQVDWAGWEDIGQVKVGARLIELLLETAYVQPPIDQLAEGPPDIRPAFNHNLKSVRGKKHIHSFGVIDCDPLVRKGLDKTVRHMVITYKPMLVPPINWTAHDRGAHLFLPSHIMRTHGSRHQRDGIRRAPREKLKQVFEALNTLGNAKWRINKKVLGIVDRIWTSRGQFGVLDVRKDVPLPAKPDTEDSTELRKWKWKLNAAKKMNKERRSLRCGVELKLNVAREFKDDAGFYYPHNIDFRGRAYPMHPHLNHLGSDLCRGILEFAEGRPLGKSGLRWLKIHLANLYAGGIDKLSYAGRIEFTEKNLEDIFDSSDRPLEGRRWWLKAEDPFQCLAVCINLTEALRSSSPETTLSYLPVHQDGSCNGLQHYAALGRDTMGAAAVNLTDGEKPADVYSEIAARVIKIMQRDIEKDLEAEKDPDVEKDFLISQNATLARLLISEVDRKLVKQTVMTSVYGVTYIGGRDQILKRLKERNVDLQDKDLYNASCYATKVAFTALGEMFEAARNMMNWLGECAKVIASQNHTVQWVTPIGLPVVQPYRKKGKQIIKTSLQNLSIECDTDKVMVKRQKTAFPPNFIHSLDGAHMMMTAIACRKAGLTFAGVHDSYWTHACDVDKMNRILRQKFVELYEKPILEDLLESFKKTFPKKVKFPPIPERGEFELNKVLESTYFFN